MLCSHCGGVFTFPRALTYTERVVAGAVFEGLRDKEIADRLNISVKTVKFHTGNIYKKLDLRSRYELISLIEKTPESFKKLETAQS